MDWVAKCRACGENDLRHRFRVKGYDIVTCLRCQSLTTAFTMTEAAATSFYDHSYFHGGDYQDYQASEPFIRRNFEALVERLRTVRRGTRLFEMGCAYGYFLDVARGYWEIAGIDISVAAVSAARERLGDQVRHGDLLQAQLPEGHYDWVVGWDMIEHVEAPRAYVAKAARLLRPGGCLALSTGDVGSIAARLSGQHWRLLTPPSHLTYFSRRGMDLLMCEAGFSEVTFSTLGYERSLDFAAFRLLGQSAYGRLVKRHPRLQARLASLSFYVDLGDIMFVTARKSDLPTELSARRSGS